MICNWGEIPTDLAQLIQQRVLPKLIFIGALCASCAWARTAGSEELTRGYQALAKKDYDTAIDLFRKAIEQQPQNAAVHKDLAYTLLKTGENAEARDEFSAAAKLNPQDEAALLEYAFLAYETKQPIQARRTFDRLRREGNPATRATAEQAFQNIDRPLAEGIARWKEALARADHPDDLPMFSAHWELGQLAELRDDLPLAAQQFEICRKLKPQLSELLLMLARVWTQMEDRREDAHAALLAASRSRDSRTAELALEQMGTRYPYPYEFLNAIRIDPQNTALRRELAYLYLAMNQKLEAIQQFEEVLKLDPGDAGARDQLDGLRGFKKRVAEVPAAAAVDAKTMGKKSLALGYSKDAVKYLQQAHEQDPLDADVMLKLGWAYNLAKDDADAISWFNAARHSPDAAIASEATTAYRNLTGETGAQTTIWALPMYSTRWHDLFTYGQAKRSFLLPWDSVDRLFTFYVSTRFVGDVKSSLPEHVVDPQYLSESSFIFGLGMNTRTWHHFTGWVEAGEAVKYLADRHDVGTAIPDYRGGLNFTKGFGRLLGSRTPGLFYETVDEAIYVSRFQKDWLFYSQHRAGRTLNLGGESLQLLFNANYVRDSKNQYWANTVELGPGFKVRMHWMPRNVYFSTDFLRGIYTNNLFNPRRPNYNDIRVSFWYAMTR
ncbi:MAG: tetratricopeptide repeat protein [Acidobacteriaceae bacterium]|nr:tetratricopeptide repeat protein [Acidobacteriaceae bacterium]